jgi:uncharacterized membrane protein YbhN (UPF0104 family)
MNPAPALSLRTWLAAAGSFGLVLAVAVGLVAWAGWEDVMAAARRIEGATLLAVLATSLACYGIRFLRWHGFTRALGHRVPWFANLPIFVAGLAMTWTPGKGGELLRGLFLARHGVPFARSILLFYWDRLSDLGGMLLLALISTLLLASGHVALVPAAMAVIFVLWLLRPGGTVFTRAVVWARSRLPARHGGWLDGLAKLGEGDTRFTPGLAAAGALAGALAYSMQALGLLLVARASGIELAFPQALLVMSVSTLAGAAVLLPAGAGVVETTSVGLLVAQGVALPEAVAVGLVHRVTTFWFAMALGAVALAGLSIRQKHA